MGDAGVATSPDFASMHWNPAKYAFIKDDMGIGVSYSPWLKSIVDGINLAYFSYYKRFDNESVGAVSLKYFSLGSILFTDIYNNTLGQYTPNEYSIDAAYTRKFSDNFSLGMAARFIRSDLSGNALSLSGTTSKAGTAFATDISAYYKKNVTIEDKKSLLSFGLNISNLGSKISYLETKEETNFIPTNLRIGSALAVPLDGFNSVTVTLDLNKLLVPTPPILSTDSTSGSIQSIYAGMDNDVAPLQGLLQSFYDAPGGYKEELKEIMYSLGVEYWYMNQFSIRAGYFHENESKGNRKYGTLGVGLKMNVFTIDFSYLVPVGGKNNPLANTMRFTLLFNFGNQNANKNKPQG
jgi:hypothetical protein